MNHRPAILIARAVFPDVVQRLREHFEVEVNDADTPYAPAELEAVPVVRSLKGSAPRRLVAVGPGAVYQSVNYRWFGARYPAFLYVDRVVVGPGTRSAGIGASLYADLETAARAAGVPLLACEVNIRPSNDRSRRFHERLGFRGVGIQDTEGGAKTVQLMLRDLTV